MRQTLRIDARTSRRSVETDSLGTVEVAADKQAGVAAAMGAAAAPAASDLFAGFLARKPKQFFDTKVIGRQVTVRPLLSPDDNGYRAPILAGC